jgi:hypothetical protein
MKDDKRGCFGRAPLSYSYLPTTSSFQLLLNGLNSRARIYKITVPAFLILTVFLRFWSMQFHYCTKSFDRFSRVFERIVVTD